MMQSRVSYIYCNDFIDHYLFANQHPQFKFYLMSIHSLLYILVPHGNSVLH